MEIEREILKFPCEFPIKIIGLNNDEFTQEVDTIINELAPDTDPAKTTTALSNAGKYKAVSVVIPAKSQDQLDKIYLRLTGSKLIKIVL